MRRPWGFSGLTGFLGLLLLTSHLAAQNAVFFTQTNELHGFNLLHRDRAYLEAGLECDIYRLSPISPNGTVTRITYHANGDGGGARDPEIGPNGIFLFYCARDQVHEGWQIYKRNLFTGVVTQLTSCPPGEEWYDNMCPRVVGTNTVAFLSNRLMIYDEYGKQVTTQLWTMDLDGNNQTALVGNLSGTITIESTGTEIITTDFAYRPLVAGTTTKDNMLPWVQGIDGSRHRPVWGFHQTHSRNSDSGFQDQLYYKPSPDGSRAVFTGVVRRYNHPDYAAGWLATTDLPVNGPEHPFTVITQNVPYDDPGPSPAGRYRRAVWATNDSLVAVWSTGGVANGEPPQWELVTMNADGSNEERLLAAPGQHLVQPVVARLRTVAPTPDPVNDDLTTFICDNALLTEHDYVHMPFIPVDLNDARTVPVRVQGVLGAGFEHSDFYTRTPRDRTFIGDVKSQNIFRYLGSVPLEADGSFSMRVPANQPITFLLQNEYGITTHVMSTHVRGAPGEVHRCGGCHTPTTPLKDLSELLCATDPLDIPVLDTPWDLDFQDDIQPILEAKCTACHAGANPAANLDFSSGRTLMHTVGFRSLSYLDPERFNYADWFDMRYTGLGNWGMGGIDSPLLTMLSGTDIIGGNNTLTTHFASLHGVHAGLLNDQEMEKLSLWCSIPNLFGSFYRFVPKDQVDNHDYPFPDADLWPGVKQVFEEDCQACHNGVATGTPLHRFIVSDTISKFALFDDYLEPTLVRAGFYCNFDQPAAQSPLLRLPRGIDNHPMVWPSPSDPGYITVKEWIESGQTLDPNDVPSFVRGDVDGNEMVTVADGVYLINYLFVNGPELPCHDAADFNDDGLLDVTDFVGLVIWQFLSGTPPVDPYPGCGEDPTVDSLQCWQFPGCD